MDRNEKIVLAVMAGIIVYHGVKLRELVKINNTNAGIIRKTTDIMDQAATDLRFYSMTNDIGE